MTAPWIDRKPRADVEEAMQIVICDHLRLRAKRDVLWWHTPNGGKRSKAQAGRLKAMGVRPGVPDLTFLFPDGHIAFLELKAENRGVISDEQGIFLDYCNAHGIEAAVAWNLDQALAIIEAFGVFR